MKYLMKCGHVANAIDKNGKPVCAICAPNVDGVTVGRAIDSETGGLEGRKAHDAERRAEVAENELKLYKLAVKIWQERYSDIRCFNFNIALKQAEKELAEEWKDD